LDSYRQATAYITGKHLTDKFITIPFGLIQAGDCYSS